MVNWKTNATQVYDLSEAWRRLYNDVSKLDGKEGVSSDEWNLAKAVLANHDQKHPGLFSATEISDAQNTIREFSGEAKNSQELTDFTHEQEVNLRAKYQYLVDHLTTHAGFQKTCYRRFQAEGIDGSMKLATDFDVSLTFTGQNGTELRRYHSVEHPHISPHELGKKILTLASAQIDQSTEIPQDVADLKLYPSIRYDKTTEQLFVDVELLAQDTSGAQYITGQKSKNSAALPPYVITVLFGIFCAVETKKKLRQILEENPKLKLYDNGGSVPPRNMGKKPPIET